MATHVITARTQTYVEIDAGARVASAPSRLCAAPSERAQFVQERLAAGDVIDYRSELVGAFARFVSEAVVLAADAYGIGVDVLLSISVAADVVGQQARAMMAPIEYATDEEAALAVLQKMAEGRTASGRPALWNVTASKPRSLDALVELAACSELLRRLLGETHHRVTCDTIGGFATTAHVMAWTRTSYVYDSVDECLHLHIARPGLVLTLLVLATCSDHAYLSADTVRITAALSDPASTGKMLRLSGATAGQLVKTVVVKRGTIAERFHVPFDWMDIGAFYFQGGRLCDTLFALLGVAQETCTRYVK